MKHDGTLRWRQRAACRGADSDIFYPHEDAVVAIASIIAEYCDRCEVRTECLEYAIERDERYGIWGGMTPKQRRALVPEKLLKT